MPSKFFYDKENIISRSRELMESDRTIDSMKQVLAKYDLSKYQELIKTSTPLYSNNENDKTEGENVAITKDDVQQDLLRRSIFGVSPSLDARRKLKYGGFINKK